jgi:hypothetical protein
MTRRSADWIAVFFLIAGLTCASQGAHASGFSQDRISVGSAPADGTSAQTPTATDSNESSWRDSLNDAAHNLNDAAHHFGLASQKAYDRVGRELTDLTLETRIRAMLHQNKYARGSDVQVMVNNGTVTLTGRVPSEASARHLQEAVSSVDGVRAVNDNLNYPQRKRLVTPRDAASMGVAHPAYSRTAPAESAPGEH